MEGNTPMEPRVGPGGTRQAGDSGSGYPQPGVYPQGGDGGGYPQAGAYPQSPPQGYGQPPYPQQHQHGVGDRAADVMQSMGRQIHTPETKPFFMTSEFVVWLITVIAIVIAGAVIGSGDHGDVLRANLVWILFTAVSIAYIVSRGISKAGTKYRDRDQGGAGRGY